MAALPTQVAADIYRIAQECLTNAVKHGSPTEVRLKVEFLAPEGRVVSLIVEDDGGGNIAGIGRQDGYGLLGMRERIAALGGRLSIGNAASGIRIAAVIPIELPA
jgi:signal transduction histidine kinase